MLRVARSPAVAAARTAKKGRRPLICNSNLSTPGRCRLDHQTFTKPRGDVRECLYTWPYPHKLHLRQFISVLPKFTEAAITHGLNSQQVNAIAAQLYFNINQLGSQLTTWEQYDVTMINFPLPQYLQIVTTPASSLPNSKPHTNLVLSPAKYTNNDIITMLITLAFVQNSSQSYPLTLGSHYASLACTLPPQTSGTKHTHAPPVCLCSWQLVQAADVQARRALIKEMGEWKPLHRLKLMGLFQDQEPQWSLMGYCNWWLSRFAADIVGDVWHDGSSLSTCLTDPAGNLAPEYGLKGAPKPTESEDVLGSFWEDEDSGEDSTPGGSNETLEELQWALQLTERNAYVYDPDEAGDDEEVGVVFPVGEGAAGGVGRGR